MAPLIFFNRKEGKIIFEYVSAAGFVIVTFNAGKWLRNMRHLFNYQGRDKK